MVHLTTALDASSGVPLYEQLYRSLAGEMRSGTLAAGTRMPGKRRLAAELSVSVNTVDAAYQMLAAEGYLESRERSGFYVQEYLALPSRFALVEVVNNHDDALQFEPIHRVLFGVDHKKFMDAFRAAYPNAYEGKGDGHTIEFVWNGESHFITVPDPRVQLAVGTLQGVIDQYLKDNGGEVDYIHGDDVTRELGGKPGNMGFLLPAMGKEQLFKTVMADGVLPRKTFSMGHAQDKRYYIEARKIVK